MINYSHEDGKTHFRPRKEGDPADKYKEIGYLLEPGVNPRSIDDPPEQKMIWHCPKCGQDWKSFKEFLYDGCSPVYGNGSNRRLEGV